MFKIERFYCAIFYKFLNIFQEFLVYLKPFFTILRIFVYSLTFILNTEYCLEILYLLLKDEKFFFFNKILKEEMCF
jgi:hypothetical protein